MALEALREQLALALLDANAGQMPALAREFRATLKDIAELPSEAKGSKVDEVADRRKARRAAAAG